jgi:hypothetical protein
MRSETSYTRYMSYMGCIDYMSYIATRWESDIASCYG